MARFRFRVKVGKGARKRYANTGKSSTRRYKRTALLLILFLVIACAIFLSFYGLYIKSSYFVVENVIIVGRESNSRVDYNKLERMTVDKNIFKLNLKDIRNYMLKNYPELFDLRLTRAFPDSIVAVITLRKPVAQLYQIRYYPIDKDGVILSQVKDYPNEKLPIISGAPFDLSGHVGKATDSRYIKKALLLLKELQSSGLLEEHKLVEINISNIRNIIFFLEDNLEIKIGYEDYALRLENLKKILEDPKLNPADIRYIDLRFKEPVIGPKWKR